MSEHFRLTVEGETATAELLKLLRQHTSKSIAELRAAIAATSPILDETPHHNQYSEFIASFSALLEGLDSQAVPYRIEVDETVESAQYVRNVFQQWIEIREEVNRMSDFESGTGG